MKPLRAGWKVVTILALALGFAVLTALLPANEYQRWQLLDGTIHARSRWIYERVHFDPTPIDVAFVGPSRIGAGVSAPQLSRALAARGLPSNVVNFSLPETGRDINAVIFEELLKTKKPRLLVIGVIEKPSRFGHSAFKYVAPTRFLVNPGYIGNLRYLTNVAYLPFRQLRLFAANLAPAAAGLTKTFDPAHYRGPVLETTGDIALPDGTIKNGTRPGSAQELARGVRKLERGNKPPLLGDGAADIEFGDERYYIRRILADAREAGVPVVFLALPYYTGPATLQEEAFYRRYGTIWNAGALAGHAELYSDYAHLTASGARVLTDWLAVKVAARLEQRR